MMTTFYYLWIILQVAVGFNLVFPVLLSMLYFVARSLSQSRPEKCPASNEADYAIIVTAYEQTDLLHATVSSLKRLNYSNYIVYVVADNCNVEGLDFDSDKVVLLRPEQVIASNTGSHFYAIERFVRPHERLTVIDSDNLVDSEYLNELNVYFDKGYKAVQGVREAKNLNTIYACLDAARDKYYHYYDGKLLFGTGSSATLAGSGMAFTTELYMECLSGVSIQGAGFDKVLQFKILERGERIAFAESAYVYDEKTAKADQLVKQRARWINTWFRYSWFGLRLAASGVVKANRNQFLFGIVLLRPPLFIFLLLSILFFGVNLAFYQTAPLLWCWGLVLFAVGFFLALLNSNTDKRIYQSLIGIPRFIFFQVLSLTKARKANKYSIATKHTNGI